MLAGLEKHRETKSQGHVGGDPRPAGLGNPRESLGSGDSKIFVRGLCVLLEICTPRWLPASKHTERTQVGAIPASRNRAKTEIGATSASRHLSKNRDRSHSGFEKHRNTKGLSYSGGLKPFEKTWVGATLGGLGACWLRETLRKLRWKPRWRGPAPSKSKI